MSDNTPVALKEKLSALSVIFAGLIAVILVLPIIGPMKVALIEPVVFRLSVLLVALPILLAAVFWFRGYLCYRGGCHLYALAVVVILSLMVSIWAYSTYQALFGTLRWLVAALFALLVYNLVESKQTLRILMASAAVGGGFMALVGALQYLVGWDFYLSPLFEDPWPAATSGNKNQAAQFVVMTLPLSIGMAWSGRSRSTVWIFSLMSALMLGFLVYARARQAWLAVIVEGVFFLLAIRFFGLGLKLNQKKQRNNHLPFVGSVFLFLVLILMPPVQSSFSLENTAINRMMQRNAVYFEDGADFNRTSTSRLKTWNVSLEMIPDFLMGAGAHNWAVHYPKYNAESEKNYINHKKTYAGDIHNDYLQLVFEFSPLVILAGLMILVGIYQKGRRVYQYKDSDFQFYFWFFCGGLMGLAVVMFFSFPLSRTLQPAYLGLYLGAIAALDKKDIRQTVSMSTASKFPICVFLIVFGCVSSWLGYRMAVGNYHLWVAASYHKKIETEFADKEKYPDVTPERMQLAIGLGRSIQNDPLNSRLAADRAALYTYLVLSEENLKHKEFYANLAKQQFQRAYQFMPYAGFLHNLNARMLKAIGDIDGQEKALLQAVKYAPGDARFVKSLVGLYIEKERLEEAFVIADGFMQRFYEGEMVLLYTYLAQETGRAQRGLDVLSAINVKLRNPHFAEEELMLEEAKVEQFRQALATQIKKHND
ncbi:MAG: O-antigen ligase family protein [Porticoccus sp.]|nr:O-antigen ligase family protein [Porticoccus sp.]MBQ0807642.1 O-antigen ligase family protein [Porticoccus sp.]